MQLVILFLALWAGMASGISDIDALLHFKEGFKEDPGGRIIGSWNSSNLSVSDGCPFNWYGVQCIGAHISSITLNGMGLVGNINFSALTGMEMLRNLSLSNNHLTGALTPEVVSISSLEFLDLSCNLFTGPIPFDLAKMENLVYLNLSSNYFGGTFLPDFANIRRLEYLDLHRNNFSGDLDGIFAQMNSAIFVDLSQNQFSGSLESISDNSAIITSLRYLNISRNGLSEDLFAGELVPLFDKLEVFDASFNQLVGNIPSFNSIGSLKSLRLGNNQFYGSPPDALLNESSMVLNELDLSRNQLTGPITSITSATLKILNLSANQLSGSLPARVGSCVVVDLSNNKLSGNLSAIKSWGHYLEVIDLSSNLITGIFPNEASQFLRLMSFDISNNSLSGSLPPEIGAMTGLRLLNIGRNNLSGEIPKEIGMLRLVYLDFSKNHFEGNIPDHLPDTLVGFNVSYNNLSGVVPDNLMRFPDSAFHPGNSLLIFPLVPSSNGPIFPDGRKNGHHVKYAIMYGLIAAAVICVTVILVSILFYIRVSNGKSTDRPPASLSFSQDKLLHSRSVSMPLEHEGISSSARESAEPEIQESSTISNSAPPSTISVCSPDRLHGDLHLFDDPFVFTAEELSRAPAEIIGRSCHGTSYKATLDGGHVLTVKWLREGITKGKKEFSKEARKLGDIRHPNIVLVRGYYWGPEERERLIISDCIDAESLMAYLCEFEQRKLQPLSLSQRLNIAVDIARGLNYLHNEKAIPHGNLKSTNIIIQSPNLNALLTDYSLHRIMTPAGIADQVLNAGALGYCPPELASTSKPCLLFKSDVYAFGVVLLELLTGKSAGEIISGNPGVVDLTDWVRLLSRENRSYECFDRRIPDVSSADAPPEVLEDMLRVALRCIHSPSERPEMKTVFQDLSSITL